jgi:carbamoyltransferase
MIILGIGGLRNDPACALLRDGEVAAAVEQRKVARRASLDELPLEAIRTCLEIGGVEARDVDVVAVARPFSQGPESETHLDLRHQFPGARISVVEHHAAHAASAFYFSGFSQATVLTLDRLGDFRCGTKWRASEAGLQVEHELYFPDSVGDLYGRVTELLGFTPNADEHKVQWLSTAGQPVYRGLFEQILPASADWLKPADRSYFDGPWFSSKFYAELGLADGAPVPDRLKADVAASLQAAVTKLVLHLAGRGGNLCLAGGLFWNALLVEALERSGAFDRVFVQPAAGNTGTALGAAALAWGRPVAMGNFCWGPEYATEQFKQVLENCKLSFRTLLTTDAILATAIGQLKQDKILAWMQGRMEFGARALGNRSILASPVNPYSTENLNSFIKHREPFRKFAASVPVELASQYFEVGENARFLSTVSRVRPAYRQQFANVILGGDFVRVHTVAEQDNPLYWRLLHAAAGEFGLPVLFNTSFNLFGDPLVCTPRDAVRSFYSSGIDAMIAGYFFLEK